MNSQQIIQSPLHPNNPSLDGRMLESQGDVVIFCTVRATRPQFREIAPVSMTSSSSTDESCA